MYCTLQNILDDMGAAVVAQLSNDSDPTAINPVVIDICITSATETIDGYLRSVYNLPLQSEHFMLRRIAIDLTKYELYNRRDNVYEAIQTVYTNALNKLKDIQRGNIVLDEGSVETAPLGMAVSKRESVFSKGFLGL